MKLRRLDPPTLPSPVKRGRARAGVVALVGLAILTAAILIPVKNRLPQRTIVPTLTPAPPTPPTLGGLGGPGGLAATVTALPHQPDLTGEEARPYEEVRALVAQCGDYHENRQRAILQHMDWLVHPSTLPPEFLVLYGDRWPGRLVFGAAYFTALDWRAGGRQPDSCLVPVGIKLNALLVRFNEQTFPEFGSD